MGDGEDMTITHGEYEDLKHIERDANSDGHFKMAFADETFLNHYLLHYIDRKLVKMVNDAPDTSGINRFFPAHKYRLTAAAMLAIANPWKYVETIKEENNHG